MTWHKQARLKIADESVKRVKKRIREIVGGNTSRSLKMTITNLTPALRGWMAYFRLTEVKGVLEEFDEWIRRRLRGVDITAGDIPALPVQGMNRRMRNRTYGGVRGRRGQPRLLLDRSAGRAHHPGEIRRKPM